MSRALSEAGVPVIGPVDVERAARLYESGVNSLKIAPELKVNHERVCESLWKAGVQIRPRPRPPDHN